MNEHLISLVRAVLVHYRTPDCLAQLLETVSQFYSTLEVTIVDHSGEAEAVIESYKTRPARGGAGQLRVDYVVDRSNPGFGAGVNRGVASGPRRPFYFIGNVDLQFLSGGLERLVQFLLTNPQYGVAGPRIMDAEGKIEPSFGAPITFFREAYMAFRMRHYRSAVIQTWLRRIQAPRPVGWVTGAAMMVRRETFEHLEGFDASYFLYYEDCDFCERSRAAGWLVGYVPDAIFRHQRGASVADDRERVMAERRRSQWRYYRQHRPQWERWLLKMYFRFRGIHSFAGEDPSASGR